MLHLTLDSASGLNAEHLAFLAPPLPSVHLLKYAACVNTHVDSHFVVSVALSVIERTFRGHVCGSL